MSFEYDTYLNEHRNNVRHAASFMIQNIPLDELSKLLPEFNVREFKHNLLNHDESKYGVAEYAAYDEYFYRDGKNTPEGRKRFDYAWLHHIRNNPHHWQYWVLQEDDGTGQNCKALDMPDTYIFEMICDWWSFSWSQYLKRISANDSEARLGLNEIFTWYDEHKDIMILSESTRKKVESLLQLIREAIDQYFNIRSIEDLYDATFYDIFTDRKSVV